MYLHLIQHIWCMYVLKVPEQTFQKQSLSKTAEPLLTKLEFYLKNKYSGTDITTARIEILFILWMCV